MNRRNFLKTGATAGALSTLSFTAAASPFALATSAEAAFATNFELNETTIGELQAKLKSGNFQGAYQTLFKTYCRRRSKWSEVKLRY
jgi:amidase